MKGATRRSTRWWRVKGDPHAEVMDVAQRLLDASDRDQLMQYRKAFADRSSRVDFMGPTGIGHRARYNAIGSICETQLARITRDMPMPQVWTVGGNFEVSQRAKLMTRYLAGDWERVHADQLREDAALDATIYGTGVIKVCERHGQPQWYRVWRGNLLVHPREEAARCVRTMYEFASVDRGMLMELYPEKAEEIDALENTDRKHLDSAAASDIDDDLVTLIEAWRLPDGPKAPGRHVIVVENATIFDEEYETDRFPFAFFHYSKDPEKFFGRGVPERLAGMQEEQNQLTEAVSDGARLLSGTKIVLYGGSTIQEDSITNDTGEFLRVDGPTPPMVLQPGPAAPDMMMYVERQRQSMYEIEGVSPMAAKSEKPAGLNSGKALITHHDIESERHAPRSKGFERFTVDLAKLHIEVLERCAGEMAKDDDEEHEEHESREEEHEEHEGRGEAPDGKHKLVAYSTDGDMLEELAYDDVRLTGHPSVVRVDPISALALTPQGKLTQLTEMHQAQVITTEEFRELYDFPDLDRSNDLAFAARDLARHLVSAALKGKAVAATRACDLEFLVKYGWQQHALSQVRYHATNADLLQLRRLIGHADSLLKQEAAAAAAEEAAQMAAAQPPMSSMPMQPGIAAPTPADPALPIQAGGFVQ